MAPVWGIFGLGPTELLLVLAVLGLGGVLLVAFFVVFVVLRATKKPRDPEEE